MHLREDKSLHRGLQVLAMQSHWLLQDGKWQGEMEGILTASSIKVEDYVYAQHSTQGTVYA